MPACKRMDQLVPEPAGWWRPWARRTLIMVVCLMGAAAVYTAWTGWQVAAAFDDVETIAFDPESIRQELAAVETPDSHDDDDSTQAVLVEAAEQRETEVYLIIGSDQIEDSSGERADVIMVAVAPSEGDPILFSLPRDLYIDTPCQDSPQRINAALNGCSGVSGEEVLAIVVEDLTGLTVDHYVELDFEGFEAVVDAVGGVEICSEYDMRDPNLGNTVIVPSGCSIATGEQALDWVRSRHTQYLIDGVWTTAIGVSDLTRNERQQELVLAVAGKLLSLGGLDDIAAAAEAMSDAVVIDDGLSFFDLANTLWDFRDLDSVIRPTVEVEYYTTEAGASVLLPVGDFAATVAELMDGSNVVAGAS